MFFLISIAFLIVADSIINGAMVIPPMNTLPHIIENINNYVFPTTDLPDKLVCIHSISFNRCTFAVL
jgi:hypothetical protein